MWGGDEERRDRDGREESKRMREESDEGQAAPFVVSQASLATARSLGQSLEETLTHIAVNLRGAALWFRLQSISN